jgi:hypothetical protein
VEKQVEIFDAASGCAQRSTTTRRITTSMHCIFHVTSSAWPQHISNYWCMAKT